MTEFSAVLTSAQVDAGEKTSQENGVHRRVALIVLTKGSAELVKMAKSDADTTMDMYENITKYIEWRKIETDLLETAATRLLWALGEAHPELLQEEAEPN